MVSSDRQRLLRLLPYLAQDRRRLTLSLVLLIPVALGAAVQPLLVGQAISALRHEPTMPWLAGQSVPEVLRTLVGLLLGGRGSAPWLAGGAELQRSGRRPAAHGPDP